MFRQHQGKTNINVSYDDIGNHLDCGYGSNANNAHYMQSINQNIYFTQNSNDATVNKMCQNILKWIKMYSILVTRFMADNNILQLNEHGYASTSNLKVCGTISLRICHCKCVRKQDKYCQTLTFLQLLIIILLSTFRNTKSVRSINYI